MVQTAIQLHTLRDIDESLPDLLSRVGETNFDGVELYDSQFDALRDDAVRERTREALDATGLVVAGAHVGVERIERDTEFLVETCRTLGCSRVVVPTYDGDAFTDRAGIEGVADHLSELADAVEGLELLYHNHTFEFGDIDGTVAFEVFVDAADDRFGFEPDVGLATHAGYDALTLLDVVGNRAPIAHLTDSNPDDPDAVHADPGTGVIDLEAAAEAAVQNGAEWLVCENGRSKDPQTTLARGSEVFESLREHVESQ
ncbi:sugar phosphate isomerase/epimerase family protein [Haloarchaeobius sp. TZWSO28]|uniref:sugar phosphate isomerase/epimerase family protein n=1 Tax=Haloarchaeobius sp. TZWSO28 TaxID=3446119 RepID=UPI003EB84C86